MMFCLSVTNSVLWPTSEMEKMSIKTYCKGHPFKFYSNDFYSDRCSISGDSYLKREKMLQ